MSTSLIEAGADVDFPTVFQEEAGLDSILQEAGRCNREGTRPAEESVVTIFQGATAPPLLFEQPIAARRRALDRYDQPDSSEAIRCYFQKLLDLKGPGPEAYNRLILTSKLYAHLLEIEDAANDLLDSMMPGMAKEAGATEELTACDPMRWVGLMNNCKTRVEEIIFAELIYC